MTTAEPAAQSNHLAGQSADYLAQHAHDPVDWYPWGAEAFERARELSRPVFLSVGYASCHWCHVMQRESFRDPETAEFLNSHFVSIKVDREERPDIDHLFLQYVTMAAGSAGWPMTVFLDGLGRPFYGGTYFPKRAPYNMQSLAAVLTGVETAFREDPARVAEVVTESMMVLEDLQAPKPAPSITRSVLSASVDDVLSLEDPQHGGLGGAPKYPAAPLFDLLVAYHRATGDAAVLDVAERWMYGMLRGGIFDQAGGGLFRYSTDEQWLVPHFEKMLSDNALLLSSIAALYEVSPSEELAHAARVTAACLERDLSREAGGYWSSIDSESAAIEGGAYTWEPASLRDTLDAAQLELARAHLGGPDPDTAGGRIILTRREGRARDAEEVDLVLARLLEARAERPLRVIRNAPADTNALAARGLLEAGIALADDRLIAQGAAVLEWMLDELVRDGRVLHIAGDEAVAGLDFLADYASLANALIAAHDADVSVGGDPLRRADGFLGTALELFEDRGALFMTGATTDLPVRPAAYDDNSSPSGWALALRAHRRLRPDDRNAWKRLFGPLAAFALHAPHAAGSALTLAVDDLWRRA